MAEVFRRVNGMPIQELIAHHADVQDSLETHVRTFEARARALLAEHRQTGDSFIEVERADVDRHLILNDLRGQRAAMSIEYGRGPDENGAGAMAPLLILHRATGARVKGSFPRSRRRKRLRK